MSRVLKKEVKTLRRKLMKCLQKTQITDKTFTSLILSIVWLHVLVDQEGKTEDTNERRRIIHEFRRRKKALKDGIQYVYEQTKQRTVDKPLQFTKRNMPQMWRDNLPAGTL